VARVYGWASPDVIDRFYIDDIDSHGLVYWYNDALEQQKEIEGK
jgi:hypothetical protein